MIYIVMDLEWNQPTVAGKKKAGLHGEIMQIAAVKITENLEAAGEFNRMVKPLYYPKINRDIRELTLLTEEELYSGLPFPEAAEEFRKWCGDDFTFVTWGPSDTDMLRNNMEIHGIDDGWIPDTFDAQLVFDDQFMQEGRAFALNYALYYFHEKPDGTHNALSDVYNTIKVMKHMDMDDAFKDEYFICGNLEGDR